MDIKSVKPWEADSISSESSLSSDPRSGASPRISVTSPVQLSSRLKVERGRRAPSWSGVDIKMANGSSYDISTARIPHEISPVIISNVPISDGLYLYDIERRTRNPRPSLCDNSQGIWSGTRT